MGKFKRRKIISYAATTYKSPPTARQLPASYFEFVERMENGYLQGI